MILKTVAVEGYRFRRWKGDLTGSQDNVTLVVDSSKTITAKFAKPSPFPWVWVVIGVATVIVAVFAVAKLFYGRAKRLEDTPPT